jgi:hypothetical protein
MHLRRIATAGALALFAASALVVAAPAAAAPVGCGITITEDTTLTANIGPCARGGIKIGADDITLNLGGFRITGKTNRTGDGVGVLLQGRTGVTVMNGTISQFDAGVAIVGGEGNTVSGVTANFNVGSGKGDFGDGISIVGSDFNDIRNSNITNNGPFSGLSMVGDSDSNEIENNVISSNNVANTGDDGIRVEGPGANLNIISGNNVSGNGLEGIAIFSDQGTGNLNTGNLIEFNIVNANGFGLLAARPGDGIRLFIRANANTVQNNTVRDNAGHGIFAQFLTSQSAGAQSNQFASNTALNNNRAGRASTFDLTDQNASCDSNIWASNTFGTASQACIS